MRAENLQTLRSVCKFSGSGGGGGGASFEHLPDTTNQLVKNIDGIYEVKVNVTPLEGHGRLNTKDALGNGKYNPAEAAAAARLETSLGKMERLPEGTVGTANADFVITTGANKGKTVDLMYTAKNLKQVEIDGINKFYETKHDDFERSRGVSSWSRSNH